jgi:hypothetical protein
MQRSSETIGTIAAALAKAQAQLVNPEKSLVGIIRTDGGTGGLERSFRYASLSSGLDIVTRTLPTSKARQKSGPFPPPALPV